MHCAWVNSRLVSNNEKMRLLHLQANILTYISGLRRWIAFDVYSAVYHINIGQANPPAQRRLLQSRSHYPLEILLFLQSTKPSFPSRECPRVAF